MRNRIVRCIALSLLLTACTTPVTETAGPSNPSPTAASLPTESPTQPTPTEAGSGEPCTVTGAAGVTAYQRPSTQAEIFGQVPDDSPLRVSGLTQEGWMGFDPGVAQAGNIGLFRLRWLPPGSGSLQGDCDMLPTLPTLPPNVCFTMAMGEEAIHSAASEASPVIGSLQANAYARVVSRTPDGWLELDLSVSSLGMGGPGWNPASSASFNGPCDRFRPTPDTSPIARLAPGSEIEMETISMVDLDHGWAVGGRSDSDQHIFRTRDGGETWIDITPPEPSSPDGSKQVSAAFHSAGTAQIAYWYSDPAHAPLVLSLWVTFDWGASWQNAGQRYFSDLAESPPLLQFDQDGTGLLMVRFFVGMGNHAYSLLGSPDGGQNYATLLNPQDTVDTCQRSALDLIDSSRAWLTGSCPFLVVDGALLEISQDGGRSWTPVRLPTPPLTPDALQAVLFCEADDPQHFSSRESQLVVRCQGDLEEELASFLYRTPDGGQSWEVLPSPGGGVYFLDALQGWAFDRTIAWTEDGGRTWQPRKTVIWQGAFSFVDAQHGWAVARSAQEIALVKTIDGGASWSLLEPRVAAP